MNEPLPTPLVGSRCTLEELELAHIRHVLAWTDSLQEAAQVLGIDSATLYRKRKRYNLEKPRAA